MSGDQVASLTKSLWARLLNLEEKKGKSGHGEKQEEKGGLEKRENPTHPGHLFWTCDTNFTDVWPCHQDSSVIIQRTSSVLQSSTLIS